MNVSTCPVCNSDETYQEQDWLGKELRHCERCETNYEVVYDLKVKEVKIKR